MNAFHPRNIFFFFESLKITTFVSEASPSPKMPRGLGEALQVPHHACLRNTVLLKYKHRALFLWPTLQCDGVVLLVYVRENSIGFLKKKKWNWIKAFVRASMLRGISKGCRHLKGPSCRSLSQILHNKHLNINSVLQLAALMYKLLSFETLKSFQMSVTLAT